MTTYLRKVLHLSYNDVGNIYSFKMTYMKKKYADMNRDALIYNFIDVLSKCYQR